MTIFAGPGREISRLIVGIDHRRQYHRAARTEVRIRVRFGNRVIHGPVIEHLEGVVRGRDFDETVSVIVMNRKPARERGIERAVAGQRNDISAVIDGRCRPRAPNRAVISIRNQVEYRSARQIALIVTDNERRVRTVIAVRSPERVNHSVTQDEAGALLILRRVENDVAADAIVAASGISPGNFRRPIQQLGPGGEIERMQPLMINTAAVDAHSHHVNRSVRPGIAIDHRCSGNSNLF